MTVELTNVPYYAFEWVVEKLKELAEEEAKSQPRS
jgi:hypothetical protein